MKKDTEINELFGKKLRLLRMGKGLSQEELGLQSGLHRTYIGQIERAEKNISIRKAYRIAKTLELDIRELFDFSDIYKENINKNK
ncbi:helix-turn-helix transcriptional regulator [Mycoplasmatota bacterium]|nr:helix-turn-helix transcriptional regulator [Mycoplasmatota bacterium]